MPSWWSMPSAVDAFPCGSRSITRTVRPPIASAVARLTAVVVLPTPPFWLAITIVRVFAGFGSVVSRETSKSSRSSGSPWCGSPNSGSSKTTRRGVGGGVIVMGLLQRSTFHVKHQNRGSWGQAFRADDLRGTTAREKSAGGLGSDRCEPRAGRVGRNRRPRDAHHDRNQGIRNRRPPPAPPLAHASRRRPQRSTGPAGSRRNLRAWAALRDASFVPHEAPHGPGERAATGRARSPRSTRR